MVGASDYLTKLIIDKQVLEIVNKYLYSRPRFPEKPLTQMLTVQSY